MEENVESENPVETKANCTEELIEEIERQNQVKCRLGGFSELH